MPRGRWKGFWDDTVLFVTGDSSTVSPGVALDSLCLELARTLKSYRLEAAKLTTKIDRMSSDLESLEGGPRNEPTPKATPETV